jgi:ribonuclease-3
MQIKINKLQKILNIKFNDINILIQATTHKSFNSKINYEILEFLGDRVLGLTISKKLIELYPNEKVGILDKKFSNLVNKNTCYEIGKKLKLNEFVLVGNSKKKGLKIENKIISDICESIIGAIYLDKDFKTAKEFILKTWKDHLKVSKETIIDAKTKLQEFSLKKFKSLPEYKIVSNTGPRHKPNFKVGVKIKNTKFIYSKGSSKKNAEQSAASILLKNLDLS